MTSARCLANLPPVEGRTGWPWDVETPALGAAGAWPRITIVTPSFGQGQFIEETIRSVLLQGYPNLQYLVIDGGSSDGTRAILEKYSPFIDHWVMEKDRGQSHAINKGLARADGEIFGWLNSDDYYAPGTLRLAGELLREGGPARWLAGQCTWRGDGEPGVTRASRVDAPLYEWMLASPIQQPASLWRRELFGTAGSLDDSLHHVMDQELFVQFRLAGVTALQVDRPLATLRLHGESKTISAMPKFRLETIHKIIPRYLANLPAEQLPAFRREVARKLLRNARASFQRRDLADVLGSVSSAIRWSPLGVAGDAARFLLRSPGRIGNMPPETP